MLGRGACAQAAADSKQAATDSGNTLFISIHNRAEGREREHEGRENKMAHGEPMLRRQAALWQTAEDGRMRILLVFTLLCSASANAEERILGLVEIPTLPGF